jgi:hypothetical protein
VLGWLAAGSAIVWGLNKCKSTEKVMQAKLNQIKTVKQNPVSTFVDEEGREHVKYPDGTVAKLPKNEAKQKLYTYVRDSLLTGGALLGTASDITITSVTKVDTRTTGHVSKKQLDSLPMQASIQVDKWMKLFPGSNGGFDYEFDQRLNAVRTTEKSGLFNMWKTPYISFFSDNPKTKITGFSKYDYPLPVVPPTIKVFTEADYNITTKQPTADIGASVRVGRFEATGYGRLGYVGPVDPKLFDFNRKSLVPSYGVKLRYNIIQL